MWCPRGWRAVIAACRVGQFPQAKGSRYNSLRGARFGKAAMPKISRDGVEIYYEVHGGGPALLLTHGYSLTSSMWQRQIEALSRHHKLVLWDMRGHGQSDYPDDPQSYSEALTVADMAALLDEGGAKSAIVCGLWLGGYMPSAFYLAHPDLAPVVLIVQPGPVVK